MSVFAFASCISPSKGKVLHYLLGTCLLFCLTLTLASPSLAAIFLRFLFSAFSIFIYANKFRLPLLPAAACYRIRMLLQVYYSLRFHLGRLCRCLYIVCAHLGLFFGTFFFVFCISLYFLFGQASMYVDVGHGWPPTTSVTSVSKIVE